ncbi:hypothetical protein NSE01_27280 [Novosphingobium sediminis]|uniref:Uncharacterized protein n=1 Tax=Novosphingobium sediminis TaxID=707214 RepID=A0A512AMH3_9SPHN|nr:hypothetical protein NSE01_27280 [Novosphingobium sediminis]
MIRREAGGAQAEEAFVRRDGFALQRDEIVHPLRDLRAAAFDLQACFLEQFAQGGGVKILARIAFTANAAPERTALRRGEANQQQAFVFVDQEDARGAPDPARAITHREHEP